jgi:hypothetical protein
MLSTSGSFLLRLPLCWQVYLCWIVGTIDMPAQKTSSQQRVGYASPGYSARRTCGGADDEMRLPKQIVFRYNDDPTSEEIDLDMDGEKTTPEQGGVIERKGMRWKVLQVNVEANAAEPFEVPVHRVFLTNKF